MRVGPGPRDLWVLKAPHQSSHCGVPRLPQVSNIEKWLPIVRKPKHLSWRNSAFGEQPLLNGQIGESLSLCFLVLRVHRYVAHGAGNSLPSSVYVPRLLLEDCIFHLFSQRVRLILQNKLYIGSVTHYWIFFFVLTKARGPLSPASLYLLLLYVSFQH